MFPTTDPDSISVESLESFSSSDSMCLFFFASSTLLVRFIVVLVLDRFFNSLFGERVFDWFGVSLSETFLFCYSLVGNCNSVCNSVLSLSVDSLDLRLDELHSKDFGTNILDLTGLSVSCFISSFFGSFGNSIIGCN